MPTKKISIPEAKAKALKAKARLEKAAAAAREAAAVHERMRLEREQEAQEALELAATLAELHDGHMIHLPPQLPDYWPEYPNPHTLAKPRSRWQKFFDWLPF